MVILLFSTDVMYHSVCVCDVHNQDIKNNFQKQISSVANRRVSVSKHKKSKQVACQHVLACLSAFFPWCPACPGGEGSVEGLFDDETQVGPASGHVHHESLGNTLSSRRHDLQPWQPLASSLSTCVCNTAHSTPMLSALYLRLKVWISQVFNWEVWGQHQSLLLLLS